MGGEAVRRRRGWVVGAWVRGCVCAYVCGRVSERVGCSVGGVSHRARAKRLPLCGVQREVSVAHEAR
eukprot:scaffold75215_cov51-Phaeocystis_antarctica.AAC.3